MGIFVCVFLEGLFLIFHFSIIINIIWVYEDVVLYRFCTLFVQYQQTCLMYYIPTMDTTTIRYPLLYYVLYLQYEESTGHYGSAGTANYYVRMCN